VLLPRNYVREKRERSLSAIRVLTEAERPFYPAKQNERSVGKVQGAREESRRFLNLPAVLHEPCTLNPFKGE